jgi:hypothetical protein
MGEIKCENGTNCDFVMTLKGRQEKHAPTFLSFPPLVGGVNKVLEVAKKPVNRRGFVGKFFGSVERNKKRVLTRM